MSSGAEACCRVYSFCAYGGLFCKRWRCTSHRSSAWEHRPEGEYCVPMFSISRLPSLAAPNIFSSSWKPSAAVRSCFVGRSSGTCDCGSSSELCHRVHPRCCILVSPTRSSDRVWKPTCATTSFSTASGPELHSNSLISS